ncbi:Farnesylcysteine lyase [Cytospora mali]|uniref:Farnesylcysteine lyase n=1 Tax=Cytospora mali TaxID=578113 RepID=A0A194V7V2_CYTMA|nr:Farnesylcysteine lyase [Valsa mali var. pyri (nom. inval.)]
MKWLDGLKAAIPGLLASPGANTGPSQSVFVDEGASNVRQVAIIGAGAAGSSAAYHLSKYAAEAGVELNITIFEKTDHIGGRTLTVDAYGNTSEPVEVGASIFVYLNKILWNATREFGLDLRDPSGEADRLTVIWNGDNFVYESTADSSWWWDVAKLLWKYGTAPYKAQKLMQSTVATFLKLYEEPYFPFRSLSTRAFELDLARITGVTGTQFLTDNGISSAFSHDIIEAATRVNYASNLDYIHGLDTMVSMAPEGAQAVAGGNWKIFDRMVAESGAQIYLNTTVSSISLGAKSTPAKPRYLINEGSAGVAFDNIVLATPYQFSDIKTSGDILQTTIDEIPYVKLHVTLFSSPFQLSGEFLNLKAGAKVPTTVLTAFSKTADGDSGLEGAGKTGFFSVSTLRAITNPATGKEEYLYKIFSPMEVTSEFLSSVLGVKVPETFTGAAPAATPAADDDTVVVEPVSWYHKHVFQAYPKALPRVTFQDPIVGNGVYYTSGMESFISTMETNALMGKNVARLIVDDALGLSTGHAITAETETETQTETETKTKTEAEAEAETETETETETESESESMEGDEKVVVVEEVKEEVKVEKSHPIADEL